MFWLLDEVVVHVRNVRSRFDYVQNFIYVNLNSLSRIRAGLCTLSTKLLYNSLNNI